MVLNTNEIKALVKGRAICYNCIIMDCIDKYKDVGCPAFRLLKRIAEDRE